MSERDRDDVVEQWRDGIAFSLAWLVLATPEKVREFHDAKARGSHKAYELLMIGDLWAELGSGELVAFGKRMTPTISGDPVQLPAHMFEFRPPEGVANGDDIEVSGTRYEGVKVVRIRESDADRENDDALKFEPSTDPTVADEFSNDKIKRQTAEDARSKKVAAESEIPSPMRGDQAERNYQDSRKIIAELFDNNAACKSAVAHNLLATFNTRYVARYSTADIKRGPISERTLREHLKAYRQELAEIGKL